MKNQISPQKIGLLDSGIGGASILKELQKKLPGHSYVYVCDNLYFPYGELETSRMIERVTTLAETFSLNENLDLLVIACNTASTNILDRLREKLKIPIVGVVPAIKPAAQLSKSKIIGIIATNITIESSYLAGLISDFASDCTVIKKGSPKLVTLSEEKMEGKATNLSEIKEELSPFLENQDLDTLVLGCTHFSSLRDEISEIFDGTVCLIDSAEAIARRVQDLLPRDPLTTTTQESLKIYFTQEDSVIQSKWWKIFKEASQYLLIP